jgi:long-chain acyl-CoA synthetase
VALLTAPFATSRADEVAVVDDRGAETWSELDARVDRLVAALVARGLEPGATVLSMVGNQREAIEVILACLHGGWLVVLVNAHFVADEVAYLLEDSGADAIVAAESRIDVALAAIEAVHRPRVLLGLVAVSRDGFEPYEEVLASAPVVDPVAATRFGGPMFYTSGTTGRPKGVRSRLNELGRSTVEWRTIAENIGAAIDVDGPGSTLLLCGPLYHSVQWVYTFGCLLNGSTVVVHPRFDPQRVLDDIDRRRVTHLHLVPTQMIRLLRLGEAEKAAFDGSSLERVFHGAAACPTWVKAAMIEWWGPILTEYYGGTEAGFLTSISSAEWLARPGSVGRPGPSIELSIVDADGAPVAPGEVGRIRFRNLLGHDFAYHRAAEKTAQAHPEAGVATLGDVGWIDDQGYLYLSDREIDMVVSGGVNIYPAEIEDVLSDHPAVVDLAVVCMPEEEMGEMVVAVVETVDGRAIDAELEAELVAYCRERLAGYKCPRRWIQVDRLPRNDIGKVSKHLLRDHLRDACGALGGD